MYYNIHVCVLKCVSTCKIVTLKIAIVQICITIKPGAGMSKVIEKMYQNEIFAFFTIYYVDIYELRDSRP